MSAALECPDCEAPAFEADAYGYFHEDDETVCKCSARLVVNLDDGTECDCDDGACGACDEWGQVHYAYVTVLEHAEDAPCSSP